MSHSRLARVLLVLLVAACLCSPAWAVSGRDSSELHLFDVLSRLWGSLTAVWLESGCKLDPHGRCAAAQGEAPTPLPTTDSGCKIDPNGGCTPGS